MFSGPEILLLIKLYGWGMKRCWRTLLSLKLRKNTFGKPEVIWPFEKHNGNVWKTPPLCFSLSHTSSLISCGVTTKSSVSSDCYLPVIFRTSYNLLQSFGKYVSLMWALMWRKRDEE